MKLTKKEITEQIIHNLSDKDIKIMIGELKHWHTKGVLVENGLTLLLRKTINDSLEEAKLWRTEIHLPELDNLIIWEVAERFCNQDVKFV